MTGASTGPAAAGTPASAVAAAVAACPAVAGLHAGPVGSYLPGRRVPGVSLGDVSARIVVDLAYPATVADLETQVRAALRPLLDVPVDIEIADVVLPGEAPPAVEGPHRPAAPPAPHGVAGPPAAPSITPLVRPLTPTGPVTTLPTFGDTP